MARKRASRGGAEPPLWLRAASFAARAHRHQLRKDGATPYFAHCVRVAMLVRDVFGCDDETALCAAYLHDTIEDTPVDYDDLEEGFGARVADVVSALTKNMTLPEPEREKEYDARLARADWRARLVKLADTYDNYVDAVTRADGPKRASTLNKARRALALARRDAQRPEIRRAVAALEAVLEG